jgi:5'(3')-deoxyribonucleotidase
VSKKLTIYVDMDNTLLDTFVGALEFSKKAVYGGALHDHTRLDIDLKVPEPNTIHTYSTTAYLKACGMTHNEAVLMRQYLFHSTEYWRTLPFMEGAEDVFQWLYANHDVYIATSAFLSQADECVLGKLRWIEENIPWFNMEHLIYSHAKYKLTGDVFIEDVWSQIETFEGDRILMDQPYNQDDSPDLRVYNWYEIGKYLDDYGNF